MTRFFLLLILNRGKKRSFLKSEVSDDCLTSFGLDLAVGGVSFGS